MKKERKVYYIILFLVKHMKLDRLIKIAKILRIARPVLLAIILLAGIITRVHLLGEADEPLGDPIDDEPVPF